MEQIDYIIRPERTEDYRETENLTREAFWNVYRPGCTEHYVLHCYRGRKEFVPELDLVMEKDGRIIGHIMYSQSEIKTSDGVLPIMTFGPVSILPECQRQGYGKALLDDSMERAKALGCGALAICGNIGFYGRSGFVPAKRTGICYEDDPNADYFLIRELLPGFLDGVAGSYRDPAGYFAAEENPEAFEIFDAQFPKKEKRKLPGQLF
ncbi:MAG: N-acetyltransferase [Roseburia sp.]|nr:N-acetyltransferase [Roseburia sp.]